MFVALNATLRRQRRRLAVLAVMLGLAGAVVTAHSVMGGDHMGDGVVMCLAVAETAVIAVAVSLVVGLIAAHRRHWVIALPALAEFAYVPEPRSAPARAGPPQLQVFRL